MADKQALSLLAVLLTVAGEFRVTPSQSTPSDTAPIATSPPNPSQTLHTTQPLLSTHPPCLPNHAAVPPAVLGLLHVRKGDGVCRGMVYLTPHLSKTRPLCYQSFTNLSASEVCWGGKCGDFQRWERGKNKTLGYLISDGVVTNSTCSTLEVQCGDDPEEGELASYKKATGFLSALVLLFIVLSISPAIYRAARERESKRRNNRWIGPMQSQSVSIHRAQTGLHPNNNTDKRHSFPGLGRLVVSSGEPSSNRNSGYDSYI